MFDFVNPEVNIVNMVVQVWLLISSILMIAYGSKMRKGQTSAKDKAAGVALITFGTATMGAIAAVGVYVAYTIFRSVLLRDLLISNLKNIVIFFLMVFHFVGAVLLINYGRVLQKNDVVEKTPAVGALLIAYGSISLVFAALTMTASGRTLLKNYLPAKATSSYVPINA